MKPEKKRERDVEFLWNGSPYQGSQSWGRNRKSATPTSCNGKNHKQSAWISCTEERRANAGAHSHHLASLKLKIGFAFAQGGVFTQKIMRTLERSKPTKNEK
jgi:hypothetical protein